jgi:hypothetical protein
LRITETSDDWGVEQERVAVPGTRVRITGLRAAAEPGIGFLEFLAPADGRPALSHSAVEDLWATLCWWNSR